MLARYALLAVLGVAVAMTSAASAGSAAAMQRDSGEVDGNWRDAPGSRIIMRNGQEVQTYTAIWILAGKRGLLKIREHSEWVDTGGDGNGDGQRGNVATGTWNAVAGTGAYARITGGGRSGHAGLGTRWNARFEGFLSVP